MIKQTYLIICILLGVWLTACQDFEDPVNNSSVVDGNMVEVSIKTNVPAITVHTKAGATTAEKQLTHVDVLVFKVDAQGDETFAYHTKHSNNLEGVTGDEIDIKVKLKVSQNNEKYRLVFIANLKEEINNFLNQNTNLEGTSKEDLLKELTFTQQEIWRDTDSEFRPLPMWGESPHATTITKDMSSGAFGTIKLLRSVARIRLGVSIQDSQEEDGSDIFEIKSVKVYNARTKGHAVPEPGNMEEGEAKFPTLVEEGTAVIPTDDTNKTKYTVPGTGENKNKVGGIYIHEAAKDEVFLIIEAIYKKDNPSHTTTFYKVGFYGTDEDDKIIAKDILRNFTYNMVITAVESPGEEDEDKAVSSTSSNLTVSMTGWSDGKMNHVVFNGQYYLAVSESTITVPKAAGKHSLLVETNYTGGWSAGISENTSWLKNVSPGSSTNLKVKETVYFDVEENNEGHTREGDITFSCGNLLSLDVRIQQTDVTLKIQVKDKVTHEYVDLEDNILHFHSGNHYEIDPQELKVTWQPDTENLIVDFDRSFAWGEANDMHTIYEDGTAYLTVVPARLLSRFSTESYQLNEWFPSEETAINIQIGGDPSTKQTIEVKKQHYEVYIERRERYPLDGEKHSFKLYSNSNDWEARFIDTDNIRDYIVIIGDNPPTGGDNVSGANNIEDAGQSLEFILKKPEKGTSINAEVIIRVKYDDLGKDITKDYVFRAYYEDEKSKYISGGEANCYMLKPNGIPVHIPVSRANDVPFFLGEQIKTGDVLTPCFIWTDHEGGYGPKSGKPNHTIANMEIQGTGPEAMLIVTPGNVEGNAVVGVKNTNGEILWSWHLWVSNFDPANVLADRHTFRKYQFLDRNLGALSDDPTDYRSLGLYYQWGRKDPFPSANGIGSNSFVKIYDENGNETEIKKKTRESSYWGDGKFFLEDAIRNPSTFIQNSECWLTGDLYTHQAKIQQFWNENETKDLERATKGVFDPCPDGWKTTPSSSTDTANPWYMLFSATQNRGTYAEIKAKAEDNTLNEDIDIGIWPHAGFIDGSSGNLSNNQNLGRYWSGNKQSDNNHQGIITRLGSDFHPAVAAPMGQASSVRCMRRIEDMR